MADALISPAVGISMLAVAAGLSAYAVRKTEKDFDPRKIPLMGMMGAFVFAAQMINFSIPGTGSSGHLGGGLMLAALLGPEAGFLTLASVLLIQALFFADGGLLALGCNVFNLGFFTCFLAFPLIYRRILRRSWSTGRIWLASLLASVFSLQLGAFSVVLETLLSGKTELPFSTFLWLMQPIHLVIGAVEGLVTASVLTFIRKARPELLVKTAAGTSLGPISLKKVLVGLGLAVLVTAGLLSYLASANPDGLEWSVTKAAGPVGLEGDSGLHAALARIQEKLAFLPDYDFRPAAEAADTGNPAPAGDSAWPAVSAGTSAAGLVGAALTLLLAAVLGYLIRAIRKKRQIAPERAEP